MKGRQTIATKRLMTPEELLLFMDAHWDRDYMSDFYFESKIDAFTGNWIVLPATEHWDIIMYPKGAGGLFSKNDCVVLTSVYKREGFSWPMKYNKHYISTKSTLRRAESAKKSIALNKEMQGPAEEVLQMYTAYMRDLLQNEGLLK